jgi:hypothetical protein
MEQVNDDHDGGEAMVMIKCSKLGKEEREKQKGSRQRYT